jgi:hypothetical protein
MPAINSTQQLAKIRSQIDLQQQIVGQLETDLQRAILGSGRKVGSIVSDVQSLYDSVTGGSLLGASFKKGVEDFVKHSDGTVPDLNTIDDEQDVIRHMLYQARALLGELRIEEQQWNTEAQEEKARKKELTDFAKA